MYQPLSFEPGMSLTVMAKLLVAAMILLPALIILGVVLVCAARRNPSASRVVEEANEE